MDRLRPGLLTGLPLVLLLAGCVGDYEMAPFGRSDPIGAPDSLTTRRVMGVVTDVPPLMPEPGNVWPAEEAPRATLQNPDAVPPQTGANPPPLDRTREPRSPGRPTEAVPYPRRGSSTALPPLDPPPPVPSASVPPPSSFSPPPPRAEGQVIPVPGGPPATITGSAGNIQTFTQPGIGTGTAIRQNGSTLLIQPDGSTVVVPTPR